MMVMCFTNTVFVETLHSHMTFDFEGRLIPALVNCS